jgi:RNA polymerase sigma-70 factor (ECF subfamily)
VVNSLEIRTAANVAPGLPERDKSERFERTGCRTDPARFDQYPGGDAAAAGCATGVEMVRSNACMASDSIHDAVNALYASESRRVLATLIRVLGDFDLAEEALHDAFRAALEQWPRDGVPSNPRAWLVSAGRFKAIDGLRRRKRFDSLEDRDPRDEAAVPASSWEGDDSVEDDRLRLIFTCCHPSLGEDAQVALTLREICGLTTEAIAQAFLTPAPTLAQRIVRAKSKIRTAGIPYRVPTPAELPTRLDAVLRVIYLVFNEGYAASSGPSLTRHDLSSEAIRLGRLLVDLLDEPEAQGLLALMLLHESRRTARTTDAGEIVRLEEQDRTQWNRELIAEGVGLVRRALASRRFGAYTLQAAIAAVHAEAPSAEATDWEEIVGLYDVLARTAPSPVVDLNRAVAVAMRDGPAAGLALVDAILARGDLRDYHLAHAARADFARRLGRLDEARAAYRRALDLARLDPERRFLQRRLDELGADAGAASPPGGGS